MSQNRGKSSATVKKQSKVYPFCILLIISKGKTNDKDHIDDDQEYDHDENDDNDNSVSEVIDIQKIKKEKTGQLDSSNRIDHDSSGITRYKTFTTYKFVHKVSKPCTISSLKNEIESAFPKYYPNEKKISCSGVYKLNCSGSIELNEYLSKSLDIDNLNNILFWIPKAQYSEKVCNQFARDDTIVFKGCFKDSNLEIIPRLQLTPSTSTITTLNSSIFDHTKVQSNEYSQSNVNSDTQNKASKNDTSSSKKIVEPKNGNEPKEPERDEEVISESDEEMEEDDSQTASVVEYFPKSYQNTKNDKEVANETTAPTEEEPVEEEPVEEKKVKTKSDKKKKNRKRKKQDEEDENDDETDETGKAKKKKKKRVDINNFKLWIKKNRKVLNTSEKTHPIRKMFYKIIPSLSPEEKDIIVDYIQSLAKEPQSKTEKQAKDVPTFLNSIKKRQ